MIYLVILNLVTPKAQAKHEPFVQQTGLCFFRAKNIGITNFLIAKPFPVSINETACFLFTLIIEGATEKALQLIQFTTTHILF
jgi:hypothetical protein